MTVTRLTPEEQEFLRVALAPKRWKSEAKAWPEPPLPKAYQVKEKA